ncbi:MAG: hypothetical protein R2827_11480 [Bdellovibrionales bacterium]
MKIWILMLLTFCVTAQWAQAQSYRSVGEHPGYVDNVNAEFDELVEEVHPIMDPRANDPSFNEFLFTGKLIKEFRNKYEDMFGRTDEEQIRMARNRFEDMEYGPNLRVTPEEDSLRRQNYGNFVLRRLTEHHLDQYARNNEDLKQVYEVKTRLSNLDVETEQGYSFNLNFRLSDNSVHMKFMNPLEIDTRVSLYMNPDALGPSSVVERQISFNYQLNQSTSLGTYYKTEDGIVTLVAVKRIDKDLSASITGKTYVEPEGITARENSVIFGISWVM